MLAIAVCAKNEEKTIVQCLDSILKSLAHVSVPWEVLIVVNGSTDATFEKVQSWTGLLSSADKEKIKSFSLPVANLVEAQRFVVERYEGKDATFLFSDADILFTETTIQSLLATFESSKEIKVVYSTSVPVDEAKTGFFKKLMKMYCLDREVLGPRKYLHGRVFATKEWSMPQTVPRLEVDDIYLSLYFLNRYGPESIKNDENSIVYFNPVSNFKDYYNEYRRTYGELYKCFRLFPELSAKSAPRPIQYDKLMKSDMKMQWFVFFVVRKIAQILLNIELLFNPNMKNIWVDTKSSKALP